MTTINAATVTEWARIVDTWIAAKCAPGKSRNDVTSGVTAWDVAHMAGLVRLAYELPGVKDAHIQTALEAIFPNVTFKDAKRY
jgi:hypothetical protein